MTTSYNFRDLFYYAFKNKDNHVFAFDVKNDIVFNFCLMFYLNEMKVNEINRLLGDKIQVNKICSQRSASLLARMNMEGQLIPSIELSMFRDSFNRASFDNSELDIEVNASSFDRFDIIVINETLTRAEYTQIIKNNEKLKLPIFLKWKESDTNLAEIFPDCVLVEKGSTRRGASCLFLKPIENGVVTFPREIKEK